MGCCCFKKEFIDITKNKWQVVKDEVAFQAEKLVETGKKIITIHKELTTNRSEISNQVVRIEKNNIEIAIMKQQRSTLLQDQKKIAENRQSVQLIQFQLQKNLQNATNYFNRIESQETISQNTINSLRRHKLRQQEQLNQLKLQQVKKIQALNGVNNRLTSRLSQLSDIQRQIKAQKVQFQAEKNQFLLIQNRLFDGFVFQDWVQPIPQPKLNQNQESEQQLVENDQFQEALLAHLQAQPTQFQEEIVEIVPLKDFVNHSPQYQRQLIEKEEFDEVHDYNPELINHNHKRFGQVKLEQLSYDNYQQNIIMLHMSRKVTENVYRSWLQAMSRLPTKVKQHIIFPLNFSFMCSKHQKEGTATFLLQNYKYVLKDELEKRLKERRYMNQAEIWHILYKIACIGLYFQKINKKIGNIHPNNIVLNQQGNFKIISSFSLPGQLTNYQVYKLRKKEIVNAYLAPEEMNLKGIERFINPPNISVAEVFSLGVTLLSVGTLHDGNKIYQLKAGKPYNFDRLEMQTLMIKFDSMHSDVLSRMVGKMLEIRPQRRIRWKTIIQTLQDYESKILSQNKFSSDQRRKIKEKMELLLSLAEHKLI